MLVEIIEIIVFALLLLLFLLFGLQITKKNNDSQNYL